LLFMTILFFGALLGSILFVQVGMHWNTVQFFYFGVAACILPAARQLEQWWEKAHPRWQPWILAAFFLLGLPGVINSWAQVRWQLKIPADAMAALLWIKHNTKPLDRILQPLPEHILTPEGYATWKRVQQRGRMTDLAAWNAETATLASVQKKLNAKGRDGSDPGLGKDPRVLENLVTFETELIALREQAASLEKDRAPLEQRESEMNQLRQAATASLNTLRARLRALQAKMQAAPTPEPLVESAIEGNLPVLNESGEIETPEEAPQNDAETATSPEEEAALRAQILGLEQEITQAQGQSDTAESAYAQVVSELMPLRSAGDQMQRSIQELETKIKALESPSSKTAPAESSPSAWPQVEGWPWPDTALVASVTHRRSFLEDLVNAQIRDYPVETRLEEVKHFYYEADVVEAREFLERSGIAYVILNAPMRLPFEENGVPMKKVYENASFYIYKVVNIKRW
jgi:predicted  nucleic acid-binding Zn-ribbon protein